MPFLCVAPSQKSIFLLCRLWLSNCLRPGRIKWTPGPGESCDREAP